MSLTSAELEMVRDSLGRLRKDFEAHSTYFYDALFRRAPELRKMFRDDLTGQGMKFMTTLDVIVQKLDDEEHLASQYQSLGRSHAILGVHAGDFAPMEEALIDTMRNALGEGFTPELEQAWRKAYAEVSRNMIRRGGIEV
ncbi:globin domain-containing protein [Fontisubflavum oceani]|uniref:globin domain-containing protein n=1 Tax=Fontisubflavum oceani TaxID=2978973 RepID=UPI0025B2BE0C|nr:globin domain-containing protein [Fontisubflavum oceani]WJY22910.1 globin domain-containing protein [Fontisubflavum oceani]